MMLSNVIERARQAAHRWIDAIVARCGLRRSGDRHDFPPATNVTTPLTGSGSLKGQWLTVVVVIAIGLACSAVGYHISPARPLANCFMDDTVRYFEPMNTYEGDVIAQPQLLLWNPYQGCGTPLLAMMQTSPLYPGNWPAMFWSTPGFKLSAVLHMILSLIGMVVWLRSLGIHLAGAAAGAIIFSTNGVVLHMVCTQSFYYAISWWPLLFWGVNQVLSNPQPRSAAVLGLIGWATIVTGGMQFVVYGGYGALAYATFRLSTQIVSRRGHVLRVVLYLAAAAACGVGLAAVQLLPSMEVSSLSQRSPEGLTASQILFFPPLGLLGAARDLVTPNWGGYLGTGLLLVLASALSKRAPGPRVLFFTVAVLTWLLTTGTGPLFDAFIHFPTGNWFRFPTRLFMITIFACATLTGFAVHDVIDGGKSRFARLLVLSIVLGVICYVLDPTRRWYGIALGTILVGASLSAPLNQAVRTTMAYTIPLALLVEALATAPNPLTPFDQITANSGWHGDLIGYLQQHQQMNRVHFRHGLDRGLPVKSGMRHHIFADFDYDPFISRRVTEYWEYLAVGNPTGKDIENGAVNLTVDAANLHLLDYLSTRYIVESPWEPFLTHTDRPHINQFKRVFSSHGYSVVQNLGALPRVAVVARAELSSPGEPLLRRLADPGFPADGTALVEDPDDVIDAPSGRGGTAMLGQYRTNRVDIIVDSTKPAMLILNDLFYPGWRATMDGQPARIALVNYLFRGVKVPQGSHHVRFEYHPLSVYLGAVVSTLSLTVVTLLFVLGRRRASVCG